MSYQKITSTDRHTFDILARPSLPEKNGLFASISSRIFRRIGIQAVLSAVGATLSILLVLVGIKWTGKSHISALIIVVGLVILVPSLYRLADILGLVEVREEEWNGSHKTTRQEDDDEDDS